ncbi:hypothetical protein ASG29_00920 [Sphingomonas sp. Leaf412]|nr:hypothetical protein ASG29_00920 [Sphingomonas sp. Leaf412]
MLTLALATATPVTLPAVLAQANDGDTIRLAAGTYRDVVIDRTFARGITIDAEKATVRGLRIAGGGILWQSGMVMAPDGRDGFAYLGYGALVTGTNVTFTGVTFTNAKKAVVLDRASGITIMDSVFIRLGEDGVIASRTSRLVVQGNRFTQTIGKPTTCLTRRGIVYGLARRDCIARFGLWVDGYHADAVQMRNAVVDATIANNVIDGNTQGVTQMDTVGDAPLRRITVEDNHVAANAHQITLGKCVDCVIRDNTVRRWRWNGYRAVIRRGRARRCGNQVQDEASDGRC